MKVKDQGDLDAVIAGGGHNGLNAAGYLAKAGVVVGVVQKKIIYLSSRRRLKRAERIQGHTLK